MVVHTQQKAFKLQEGLDERKGFSERRRQEERVFVDEKDKCMKLSKNTK